MTTDDIAKALQSAPIKIIKASTIAKCPHVILAAEHYRDDGTCKCNDPNETIMAEWGYVWRDGAWQYDGDDDD